MAQLIDKIEILIQPILEDLGYELVDLEYQRDQRGWILQIFLDKEGGINLDNCAAASREISSLLDVENIIPTAYNLEVSSPGIERPLKRIADFERFAGQLVKIKTLDSIDPDASGKNKKTFSELEMEKLSLYSCEDADFTERLRHILKPKLKK